MNRIKLTALIFSAAMLFTACQPNETPTPYELYSHTADNIGTNIIEAFDEEFKGLSVMSEENSEKLRTAVSDIRINNSRIAIPILVSDLPEGFQVQYGRGGKLGNDYMYFEGELIFGGDRIDMPDSGAIIMGGEKLADVQILKGSGLSEAEGVIFALTLSSDKCKWSIGEADICASSELERIFGTPSAAEIISDENIPDLFYVTDSGEYARFVPSVSSVMIASLDCTRLEENKALCEYIPCKDFEGMTDLPPVTGEKKKFDALNVFSNSTVTIGDFSCPPYTPVKSLDSDISLILRETTPIENTESVSDNYLLLYKGRYFGSVTAMRKSDLPADEGMIYAWYISGRENLPCDASLAGIPVSQDTESIAECFENCEIKEDGSLVMYDTCELDGQKLLIFYSRNSGITGFIAEPISE